jgi:IPT/TIG domain-containing protein/S-layer family protein
MAENGARGHSFRLRRTFGMRRCALAVGLAFLVPAGAHAQAPCSFHVAPPPAGSDANPGTAAAPWATLDHASSRVFATNPAGGCTVWFADGVYTGSNSLYERFGAPTWFKAMNRYRAVFQRPGPVMQLFGARNMVFEGLRLTHTGPGASGLVVQVQMDGGTGLWAEDVTFRDNVFHDSWNNDLLKINNGARNVRVEGNVFYNQTGSDEHIDINGVTDVVVSDNLFFNDFAGSGRPNNNDTSGFIVIKDSGALIGGCARIAVRRNVFLNWEGSAGSNFVLLGEDGQPFHEAHEIVVENNLMIGNSANEMRSSFGVKGGRDVTFRANTITGNLPSCAYAMRLNQEGSNPPNQDVRFWGNVWSDPTGTMGAGCGGGNDFSDGAATETVGARLDRNLYWNGAQAVPPGDVLSPLVDDARRIVADPGLNANQAAIVLPRWTGTAFPSGSTTIRQEFERLVAAYGVPAPAGPTVDQGDAARMPADDIRGRPRGPAPDLGAFEAGVTTAFAILPTSGPAAGGARLTLTGSGFQPAATVTIGGVAARDVFVGSATFALATAPGLAAGTLHAATLSNPGGASFTIPEGYLADFLDVPADHLNHRFVESLVRSYVTGGCGAGNYCPDAPVTREQMAVFLLTAKGPPGYVPPPCVTPQFGDVPCSSPFARWINELVARGITGGCGAGNYCPASPVTRGQMSVFLVVTFGL